MVRHAASDVNDPTRAVKDLQDRVVSQGENPAVALV